MSKEKSEEYNKLIILVFGLSGMSALIYEIVWIRSLSIVFKITTYAVSIITVGFLSESF